MSEVSTEPAGDLVERVARAMAESDNCYYFAQTDNPRDEHWRLARAAIAAMPSVGEVEQLNGALSAYKAICEHRNQQNESLRTQLAASQADVARLRELLFESLYHLRMDDAAKAYHNKVMADRAAIKETQP